ncbi:hypothetical protein [Priestia aryabhattai]|uniref:hypothetical protein n=1 Tax=Priestia aryabhattai TaxID=412384 RepID=UPI002E1EA0F3|nr:hypothetical protein [Priestia aryabhattai]
MGYILPVTPYQSIQYANRLQKIMLLFQIVFGLSRKKALTKSLNRVLTHWN